MISKEAPSNFDPSESASQSFGELIALADKSFSLYNLTSDRGMLDLAEGHYRAAFDLGPASDNTVDHASAFIRFQRVLLLGGKAIADRHVDNAIQFTPPAHHLHPVLLSLQASSYLKRYQESKDTTDLNSAVEMYKNVVDTTPTAHPQRVHLQMQYASALHTRYTALRDDADLDLSIQQFWMVLDGCPDDLFVTARWSLAMALDSRCQLRCDIQDIDFAIQAYATVIDMLHQQPRQYLFTCVRYASILEARWHRTADIDDLHIALRYCEIAVNRCPPNHEHYVTVVFYYSSLLITRSQHRESIQDADAAIQYIRNAMAVCHVDESRRPMLLSNLGYCLTVRFMHCGDATDLESAVENCHAALSLGTTSLDAGDRAGNMNRLAFALFLRFQLQGDTADSNDARRILREAFELCPSPHSSRLPILNNYARVLGNLGKRNSDITDIDLSIEYFYKALDLCYASARSVVLTNLGVTLFHHHSLTGSLSDIEESFLLLKAALELQPEDYPLRGLTFLIQAKAVVAMFPHQYTIVDTEIALDILRAAEDSFTAGQPLLIETYRELARIYSLRHSITHNDGDLEEAFKYRIAAAQYPNGGTEVQFQAAMQWVESGERFNHSSLLDAYKSAILVLNLHLVLKPSLNLRYDIIRSQASICVDATSCALRRGDVVGAVEIFEHSRGLFWASMARLRTPLDELRASGPDGRDLVDEFENLSRQLETPMTLSSDGEHGQRFRRIQRDWNAVVDKIRSVDGFDKFLLPPSYDDLRAAAIGGPVIILNASQHSCDAIIVLADTKPIHVPFPDVTITKLWEMSSNFKRHRESLRRTSNDRDRASDEKELLIALRDLWDAVVCEVVRRLEPYVPKNSRIWWCPTGVFTTLPIHAASPFRKRGLSGIYVSSYTPTLSALIRSRRMQNDAEQEQDVVPRFVFIGQPNPNSTGFQQLSSVRQEFDLVRQHLPEAVQVTELMDAAATCEAALSALSTHAYAHLSCHGKQELEKQPFLSYFAMGDGPLTLLDIIRGHEAGHEIEFAFLSACQTAVGDEHARDEVIHLAAALQFAGARNVIGTMWSVDDDVVVLIVEAFYRAMVNEQGVFDPSRAARALRVAIRTTKDHIPVDQQMVFIHIGV